MARSKSRGLTLKQFRTDIKQTIDEIDQVYIELELSDGDFDLPMFDTFDRAKENLQELLQSIERL